MLNSSDSLINYLRTLTGAWRDDTRDDAELLARFVDSRDETAFRILACRHGPMVWRTCKRVLGNNSDAEDAFQVTFMALARQASQVRWQSLAGWLHKVARRTSLDAGAKIQRRRKLEHQPLAAVRSEQENVDQSELYAAIDEELTRLPEKLRVPLVLRYLEEKTQAEVARVLGCVLSVAQKRLARGEAILRERLERRGLTLGVGSMAVLLGNSGATSALPNRLIESTSRAAVAFCSGTLTGASVEAAEKLLRSKSLKGLLGKSWWIVLASVGLLGIGGAGLVAWKMFGDGSHAVTQIVQDMPTMASIGRIARKHSVGVDLYSDPLPKGAIARIGTVRFRGVGEGSEDSLYSDRNGNLNASVALSSDGKTLVLADGNGIYIWDAKTGCQLNKIAIKCKQVALSPNATLLAAHDLGTIGGCIRLIDTTTGQFTGEPLHGYGSPVFTPDGKTIACLCENSAGGSFYLYDVGTRKLLRKVGRELIPDSYIPTVAQFSPDGQTLACVFGSGANGFARYLTVDLLDVKTGKKLSTLQPRQETIRLAFAPDGNIITGERDKIVRIRDAKTGKELRELGVLNHVPTVLDFLPDGRTVLAACAGQIRFWDATTGKESRPALTCHGLLRPIILSTDGTKLIEQVGNAVSIWDVATGKEIGPTAGVPRAAINCVAFSPDGKFIVTDAEKIGGITEPRQCILQLPGMAAFHLWNATGKLLGSLPIPANEKAASWWEVVWASRDTVLAQGQYANERWPAVEAQDCLTQWKITTPRNVASGEILRHFIIPDGGASLAPDGRILASCKDKCDLLEIDTGKKITSVPVSDNSTGFLHASIKPLVFSTDHRILASQLRKEGGLSQTITLWETSTGSELYHIHVPMFPSTRPHEKPAVDELLGISPDGRLTATCNPINHTIAVWENASGHARWHLSMPEIYIHDPKVAFSPDSHLLAIGCSTGPKGENSIQIWDLHTGKETQRFHGHNTGHNLFSEIVFSPDERCLASASQDYTALIWGIKQPPIPEKANQPLSREELQALKTALTGIDASVAYHAINKLRLVPEQAVSLAVECLRPQIQSPEAKRTSQSASLLIDGLDSDDFWTRTKSERELRKMLNAEISGLIVQSMLIAIVSERKRSLEVNKTLIRLLAELKEEQKLAGARSLELSRMLRSIEMLELIHNDSAQKILQQLAKAPPCPEIQREAEAALKRLATPQSP